MPRRNDYLTEREALEIVRDEERARGWTPGPPLSKRREREEGCDFLSAPPNGGVPHPVEVKSWGGSVFLPDGRPRYWSQDINEEQRARAERDPNWRLEIVANLEAARTGYGDIERLTVRASDIEGLLKPWKYRIDLTALLGSIRRVRQPEPRVGTFASDRGDLSRRASEDEFEPEPWRS